MVSKQEYQYLNYRIEFNLNRFFRGLQVMPLVSWLFDDNTEQTNNVERVATAASQYLTEAKRKKRQVCQPMQTCLNYD